MTMLYLGLALFFLVHLVPIFARPVRAGAVNIIGMRPYQGLFALASFGALYLVVMGWKATDLADVYVPPAWGMHVTPLLVLVAFILFIGSRAPGNFRRYVRHPQLTAVLLWAVGHLFANGENRSVALFGGFAVWAIVSMWGSSRRDGPWVKPEKQPVIKDIVTVVIAAALYAGFIMIHEWLIGVRPMP